MKSYVIDVNVLFSGVLSQKEIYRIMFSNNTFYTPDFALIELNKYREVILKKTKLEVKKLHDFTLYLFSKIIVVPDYIISEKAYKKAEKLCKNIDIKDVVYVALNEELGLELLTRDKVLRNGLINQGYTKILLFNDFINEILKNERENKTML
ncbi:MAG: hypothetical protein KAT68_06075 [Bacteroidales bacterium]|nr:hypothetical protein [Bacteroidales bacterium]